MAGLTLFCLASCLGVWPFAIAAVRADVSKHVCAVISHES